MWYYPIYVVNRHLRWAIKGSLIESIRVNREEPVRNGSMVGILIGISKWGGESR